MTEDASPTGPKEKPDLARYLQDWTELWREELRAQHTDPDRSYLGLLAGLTPSGNASGALDAWRAAMLVWAAALGLDPGATRAPPRDDTASRAAAAAAASDARDDAIERLTRRVDALEARLAELDAARSRRR